MKRSVNIVVNCATHKPYRVAEMLYAKWSKIPLEKDLAEYITTGCVISTPRVFALAHIIDLAEPGETQQPAWFVRVAVGEITELLRTLPCKTRQICFCRRGEDKMRVYDMERFWRLAFRKKHEKSE